MTESLNSQLKKYLQVAKFSPSSYTTSSRSINRFSVVIVVARTISHFEEIPVF
jgi:hypothetical protein